MITLQLNSKQCMQHLLTKPSFDKFSFIEGEITTFIKFTIDGYLKKEFFEEAPTETHSRWEHVRDYCFQIIKGKRVPLSFQFVLSLAPTAFDAFLAKNEIEGFSANDISGLYLNFKFDGSTLTCTSGTSLKLFTLDKSIENCWDKYMQHIFTKLDIPFDLFS